MSDIARALRGTSREVMAWAALDESVPGSLPGEAAELVAKLRESRARLDGMGRLTVPSTSDLRREGVPLEDVMEEQRRREAEAAEANQAWDDESFLLRGLRGRLDLFITRNREDLIVGIRPAVTALIDSARDAVARGWGDEKAVLAGGAGEALEGLQGLMKAEETFSLFFETYRESYRHLRVKSDPHTQSACMSVNDSHRYWERPALVASDALAGRTRNRRGYLVMARPTLRAVAAESPECGFRMAVPREVKAVFDRVIRTATVCRMDPRSVGIGFPEIAPEGSTWGRRRGVAG